MAKQYATQRFVLDDEEFERGKEVKLPAESEWWAWLTKQGWISTTKPTGEATEEPTGPQTHNIAAPEPEPVKS